MNTDRGEVVNLNIKRGRRILPSYLKSIVYCLALYKCEIVLQKQNPKTSSDYRVEGRSPRMSLQRVQKSASVSWMCWLALLLASLCSTGFWWGCDQVHKQDHHGYHWNKSSVFCQEFLHRKETEKQYKKLAKYKETKCMILQTILGNKMFLLRDY